MGQQLFGSARSDARHRPNNGFLKAFDVLRPWLTNDKGRWPLAGLVAPSLTERDQEICGLFKGRHGPPPPFGPKAKAEDIDRKSTRLNSKHNPNSDAGLF